MPVTPSFVRVAPDSTGKLIDNVQVVTTAGTVQRQVVAIADSIDPTKYAAVGATGLQVDGSGVTQPVSGTVGVSGSVAATIADGADVAEGAKADAAVQGDNSGSVSAKLRGLNKTFGDEQTGSSTVTFTNGAGGPITIPTPGEGCVVVKVVPTLPLTGGITFKEQLITGGVYTDALAQAAGGQGQVFPLSKYEIFEGSIPPNYGTPFYLLMIRARGINVQIGNGITAGAGNLVITAIYKKGAAWNFGTFINGVSGFAMEVTNDGSAFTTLIPPAANLLQASDPLALGAGTAYPGVGEGVPIVGAAALLNDTVAGQLTTLPGDGAHGAFVNVQAFKDNPVQTGTGASGVGVPRVTASFDSPVGLTASGNLTLAGDIVSVSCKGASVVIAQITATTASSGNSVIFIEVSTDNGTTWGFTTGYFPRTQDIFTEGLIQGPANYSVGDLFYVPCGGFTNVRFRALQDLVGTWTLNLTTSGSNQLLTGVTLAANSRVEIQDVGGGAVARVLTSTNIPTSADNRLVVALSPESATINVNANAAVSAQVVTEGEPDYLSTDGEQPLTQNKDGRLRVIDDNPEVLAELTFLRHELGELRLIIEMALT